MRPAKKRALQETQKTMSLTEIMTWLVLNAEFATAIRNGEKIPAWIINEGVEVPEYIAIALDMWRRDFSGVVFLRRKDVSHLN